MKASDRYHKWVEWSDEDQIYIGKCPDLITGIHGDDPVKLYSELCEVVDEVIHYFAATARSSHAGSPVKRFKDSGRGSNGSRKPEEPPS